MQLALMALLEAGLAYACDAETLEMSGRDAFLAYEALDEVAFGVAVDALEDTLACLREPLTPALAANYHQVRALAAYIKRDNPAVLAFFIAAQSADPGQVLPAALAPAGHPLHDTFQAARATGEAASHPLAPPVSGQWLVDGVRARRAPAARPYLLQQVAPGGSVVQTRLMLAPTTVLPPQTAARRADVTVPVPPTAPAIAEMNVVERAVAVQPEVSSLKTAAGARTAVLGAGAGLMLVGVGLYAEAFSTRRTYEEARLSGDLHRARTAVDITNGLTVSGLIALGAGGVLVVGATF